MTTKEDDHLLKEIDAAHASANEALQQKDFAAYAHHFADDLTYTQLDGRTIDKPKLVRDISVYFNRIKKVTNHYERISFEVAPEKITERLVQKSHIAIRIFIFFSKKWTVEREGIYEWRKNKERWEIYSVKILAEKVY